MKGRLFIISAPSGAGKTTLLKRVMADLDKVRFSVSHTTRAPRTGEQDGVDYYFVDRAAFEEMRAKGDFLEWAEVHGNYYGTSRAAIEAELARGNDMILDIDVQGAQQIRDAKLDPPAISIFIAPPSWEELERRLTARGTDSEETIKLRMQNAYQEMADSEKYDYSIVNDQLDEAVDMLRSIILAERSRSGRSQSGNTLEILS
jgi:guanylate kinase